MTNIPASRRVDKPMPLRLTLLALLFAAAIVCAEGKTEHVSEDHADGSPKVRGTLVDGKREGVWKEWHENRKPKSEVSYAKGKWHGPRKEWYDNGQVMIDWTYTDGRPDKGVVTVYHRNGKVR